jgi:hypothetical protein
MMSCQAFSLLSTTTLQLFCTTAGQSAMQNPVVCHPPTPFLTNPPTHPSIHPSIHPSTQPPPSSCTHLAQVEGKYSPTHTLKTSPNRPTHPLPPPFCTHTPHPPTLSHPPPLPPPRPTWRRWKASVSPGRRGLMLRPRPGDCPMPRAASEASLAASRRWRRALLSSYRRWDTLRVCGVWHRVCQGCVWRRVCQWVQIHSCSHVHARVYKPTHVSTHTPPCSLLKTPT